ncbi:hypothetical protein POTOM_032279 [Populus tomentosa]|uniref:Uncharacterized protein n=1 Tax=Populus tomentosa TaxID=118781 RepID=A0A8X7ZC38_POPTO|nr:hypothetical protein POTOM_032279 [Populus tomentosa]
MITPGEQNRVPASILANQVEQGYGSVLLLGTALIPSNLCQVLQSRRARWMTKQTRYPTETPLSLSLFLARSSSADGTEICVLMSLFCSLTIAGYRTLIPGVTLTAIALCDHGGFSTFRALIIVEDGDQCGGRDWESDPDISGANDCIEAYSDKMLFRKCGVSQVQEEGSKPGEMPR